MKIYNSMIELIGNTPLVRLKKIEEKYKLDAKVVAKVEMFNPSGSVKVRPATNMILKALEANIINKDTIIIEPTSGNTGISMAFVCALLGLNFIAVMPENMSVERRKIIKAHGAEIVLTKRELGMAGSVTKAKELQIELNGFIPSQFDNIHNPNSHNLTAKEIMEDSDGMVDIIVCGVGTGGTISGIGNYIKKQKDVLMVAVEPESSPLLSRGIVGKHKISGIGANFMPDNLDMKIVDKIICISDEEAIFMAKELAKEEGMFVGISSGAALAGAIKYIQNNQVKDKMVVVVLPDTGERYLSTELIDE